MGGGRKKAWLPLTPSLLAGPLPACWKSSLPVLWSASHPPHLDLDVSCGTRCMVSQTGTWRSWVPSAWSSLSTDVVSSIQAMASASSLPCIHLTQNRQVIKKKTNGSQRKTSPCQEKKQTETNRRKLSSTSFPFQGPASQVLNQSLLLPRCRWMKVSPQQELPAKQDVRQIPKGLKLL